MELYNSSFSLNSVGQSTDIVTPRLKELIKTYGTDTLSYFSLQKNRKYFFDISGKAFLSYRLWSNIIIVSNDPVGSTEHISHLIQSFTTFAHTKKYTICFLGISKEYFNLFHTLGFKSLKIGEESIISLSSFDKAKLKKKVRRSVNYIQQKGITVQIYQYNQMPIDIRNQIDNVSQEWLEKKGGKEYGFSMNLGTFSDKNMDDCHFICATHEGKILAFLHMMPVYPRNGWSLNTMRKRKDTPNGLMEFLIISALEEYKKRNYTILSLNFAVLSNSNGDISSKIIEKIQAVLFHTLPSYYQLKSLYTFNKKFSPVWHSRYMFFQQRRTLPLLTFAIIQNERPLFN